jgi:hypothetical protein
MHGHPIIATALVACVIFGVLTWALGKQDKETSAFQTVIATAITVAISVLSTYIGLTIASTP